jgi:hypothetical protein
MLPMNNRIGMLRTATPLLLAALIGIAAYTGMLELTQEAGGTSGIPVIT